MNNQETYQSLFPSSNLDLLERLKVIEEDHFIITVQPCKEETKKECCQCESKCDCEEDTKCKCINLKEIIDSHC